MNRLIGINEASKRLGVSISTLRRWGESGVLFAQRTPKDTDVTILVKSTQTYCMA